MLMLLGTSLVSSSDDETDVKPIYYYIIIYRVRNLFRGIYVNIFVGVFNFNVKCIRVYRPTVRRRGYILFALKGGGVRGGGLLHAPPPRIRFFLKSQLQNRAFSCIFQV
jgi:hypothetical protein